MTKEYPKNTNYLLLEIQETLTTIERVTNRVEYIIYWYDDGSGRNRKCD